MKNLLILVALFSVGVERARSDGVDSHGLSPTEIVLGQSAAFTGTSAGLGTELWLGAQAYFDSVNSKGGVKGRKIRVVALDDKYDAELALPNTLRLITGEKVFALFGYVGTPTLVRALPAVQRFSSEGIFLFSNFTGAQPQRELPYSNFVFNVRPSYRQETKAIIDRLAAIGHSRIGLFIQSDAYGRSGADGVERALKQHNLAVLKETTYLRGSAVSTSMESQVKLLLDANVQAIISIASYAAAAAFVRDARLAGFRGPIANVSFVGADSLLEKLHEEGRRLNKDLTKKLINTQVVPIPDDKSIPLVREYMTAMGAFSPHLPPALRDPIYTPRKIGFGSLEGFLNAKVFVEILKRTSEPLTRQSFRESAEHFKKVNLGLQEQASLSKSNHQALQSVFFTTIREGKYAPLENWEMFR